MNSINIIKPFIKENLNLIIVYLLFTLLSYPLESVIIPKISGSFFSQLNENSDNSIYYSFFLKTIFFTLIVNISSGIMNYLDAEIIPKFNEYIVNTIYKKLLYSYQNSYKDMELGKIISRINTIPSIIRELTTDLFNWILPRIITIVIINIYLLTINISLGLLSIVLLILLVLYNVYTFKNCVNLSIDRYKSYEDRAEITQDKLSNLFSIYASGNIKEEINNFASFNAEYKENYSKSIMCNSSSKFINNIFQVLIFLLLNGYIIYLFKTKQIKYDVFISTFMILMYYLPCIITIVTSLPDYILHIGIIKFVDDFLPDIDQIYAEKKLLEITHGKIHINNLNFSYNKEANLFNNFNLNIMPNEKIALIGESGNGKSSIIKIIMGYFNVENNCVFIDDHDINDLDLEHLRSQITFINQNSKLFNDTIYYNIQYGNSLTKEEINNIINKFNINKIFDNLEKKLDTIVGVNGDMLSGGQKQITQILRAFGKKNKIIILDEPTAALDNFHREIILNMINELGKNSTIIMITHDKYNLKFFNRIITISNGSIIEDKKV